MLSLDGSLGASIVFALGRPAGFHFRPGGLGGGLRWPKDWERGRAMRERGGGEETSGHFYVHLVDGFLKLKLAAESRASSHKSPPQFAVNLNSTRWTRGRQQSPRVSLAAQMGRQWPALHRLDELR